MYRLLSLLLQYPEDELLAEMASVKEELAEARGAAREAASARIEQFLSQVEARSPEDLRALFVETFDFHAETSLNLTYHLWGDLRERGQVLAALKTYYREAGLVLESGELPDYLPLMLEFAAEVPVHGENLLQAFSAPIEVLRRRLNEQGSLYAPLLEALAEILPTPGPEVEEEVRKILAGQPPQETSGLDPMMGLAEAGLGAAGDMSLASLCGFPQRSVAKQ